MKEYFEGFKKGFDFGARFKYLQINLIELMKEMEKLNNKGKKAIGTSCGRKLWTFNVGLKNYTTRTTKTLIAIQFWRNCSENLTHAEESILCCSKNVLLLWNLMLMK